MKPWTSDRPANRFAAIPRGLLGRLGGWAMARGNREAQEEVLGVLGVKPGDRVLEVGHGPGVFLRLVLDSTDARLVAGVDPSDVMRSQAASATGAETRERAEIREGSAASIPYEDGAFDHVVSVNNVAIWPALEPGLAELARVTRPEGTIAIAWHSRTSPSRFERAMGLDEEKLTRIRDGLARHCETVERHDLTHVVCYTAAARP